MKKIFYKISTIVVFAVLIFTSQSFAGQDDGIYSYVFHLYYDNGQLFADRDFTFKYDLIAEPFVQETLKTTAPFKGEIINVKNNIDASFQFDPKQGNQAFNKGNISVKGPYFADASKVNFYNNQGQLLLILDVAASAICDDDGICNSATGEDYQNCPNDCKVATPTPSQTVPIESGTSVWIWVLIIAIIVIVVVLILWIIIKRRRNSDLIPPPPPSLQ